MINAGSTIEREDGTFASIFFPFSEDFQLFNAKLQNEIEEVKNSTVSTK
jgi:chloramphenicol O-acetyltransferase type A